jgi:dTDP-4-amino-4,6-dideoxygalactose transaminase
VIPLCDPYVTGDEITNVATVLTSDHWHGDGSFTKRATELLKALTGSPAVLTTTSGTHALELAAILLGVGPGDEVICPSFTFSSTATAMAIRGATPVFVDSEPETMNLDIQAVEAAITPATKAVVAMHYGGVGVDLDRLVPLCRSHGLALVEDAAHGLGGSYDGAALGTFGEYGALSFHDTKNVAMGEGGAILASDADGAVRAEIIREKGTNRSQFLRGVVDKYTWTDHGSSYLPAELLTAVLCAQLEHFDEIQRRRHRVWDSYATNLPSWAAASGVDLMTVPDRRQHPAHLYYVILPTRADQSGFIAHLRSQGIVGAFHYQPLDTSPAGRQLGRTPAPCVVAQDRAHRLVRLPLYAGLTPSDLDRILTAVTSYRPLGA